MNERGQGRSDVSAVVAAPGRVAEDGESFGYFIIEVRDADGALVERREFKNTLMTAGKNDLADKYFAGSSYTAGWYLGLISDASYSAISSADTAGSHGGWLEAGGAHDPVVTNLTRPAATFGAASAGVKATNSASVFAISTNLSSAKIKGAFLISNSAIDGTSGVLFSAGLFTGGDLTVLPTYTVNVSWQYTV